MSRFRDPQLQVGVNYSDSKPNIYKSWCLTTHVNPSDLTFQYSIFDWMIDLSGHIKTMLALCCCHYFQCTLPCRQHCILLAFEPCWAILIHNQNHNHRAQPEFNLWLRASGKEKEPSQTHISLMWDSHESHVSLTGVSQESRMSLTQESPTGVSNESHMSHTGVSQESHRSLK